LRACRYEKAGMLASVATVTFAGVHCTHSVAVVIPAWTDGPMSLRGCGFSTNSSCVR